MNCTENRPLDLLVRRAHNQSRIGYISRTWKPWIAQHHSLTRAIDTEMIALIASSWYGDSSCAFRVTASHSQTSSPILFLFLFFVLICFCERRLPRKKRFAFAMIIIFVCHYGISQKQKLLLFMFMEHIYCPLVSSLISFHFTVELGLHEIRFI